MAVIAVLVVVAIVAVLAAALMARQATAIRAAQAGQTQTQARWLLQGEISRAQAALYADAQRDVATRLDGLWARPVAGVAIGELGGEQAFVFSEIIDEQSKFNLRNLVQGGLVDPQETDAFLRLCLLVGVPRAQANLIARRVIVSLVAADMQLRPPLTDEEMQAALSAAEALGIGALGRDDEAPRLRELDDLAGVPGVDVDAIALLRPLATVLPERTWINANTARPEVLAARVPGLSLDRAKALLDARNSGQWFVNRGDFLNRLPPADTDRNQVLIGITSQWFQFSGALRTGRTTLIVRALLHGDKEALPRIVWLREGV